MTVENKNSKMSSALFSTIDLEWGALWNYSVVFSLIVVSEIKLKNPGKLVWKGEIMNKKC